MFTQSFFLGNRLLGTTPRSLTFSHAEPHPPRSYAYFCPKCAEIWARCPVQGQLPRDDEWMVWTRDCSKHPHHPFRVSGSLLLPFDKSFNDALPDEAWKHELQLHLAYAEQFSL